MMSDTSRAVIRDVLRGQGHLSLKTICKLLGAETGEAKCKVYHQVGGMFRDGVVTRIGEGLKMKYALVREPATRPTLSPEQRKERRRAMEHARYIRRRLAAGGKSRAEHVATRKAKAKPKPARQPTYSAPRASKSRPANQQPSVYRQWIEVPMVEEVRLMTSEEWLALGGVIERIPAHWEQAA